MLRIFAWFIVGFLVLAFIAAVVPTESPRSTARWVDRLPASVHQVAAKAPAAATAAQNPLDPAPRASDPESPLPTRRVTVTSEGSKTNETIVTVQPSLKHETARALREAGHAVTIR